MQLSSIPIKSTRQKCWRYCHLSATVKYEPDLSETAEKKIRRKMLNRIKFKVIAYDSHLITMLKTCYKFLVYKQQSFTHRRHIFFGIVFNFERPILVPSRKVQELFFYLSHVTLHLTLIIVVEFSHCLLIGI